MKVIHLVISFFSRIGPIALAGLMAWFLYQALVHLFVLGDIQGGIGRLVLAIALLFNIYLNRKKYAAQVKGRPDK